MPPSAWDADREGAGLGAVDPDVLVLLHDELARLEQENRMLREAVDESHHADPGPDADVAAVERRYEERIQELTQELMGREETIGFLLDQMALAEQAEAALKAEYKQLEKWLDQLEERVETNVEGPGPGDPLDETPPAPAIDPAALARLESERDRLRSELESERRTLLEARTRSEADRRKIMAYKAQVDQEFARLRGQAGELKGQVESLRAQQVRWQAAKVQGADGAETQALVARNAELEGEIARLRERATAMQSAGGAADPETLEQLHEAQAVLQVMDEENRRLRQTCLELTKASDRQAEADMLRTQVETLQGELSRIQVELRAERDERERERNVHETAIVTLQSQSVREAMNSQREQISEGSTPAPQSLPAYASRDTSIDERIRAFREHLRDVHVREEEERQRKSFTSRLSKVWMKSRPK
jgi:DNA repair exonuclease SbcCD ATPase subunit